MKTRRAASAHAPNPPAANPPAANPVRPTSRGGFASLDPATRQRYQSAGGKQAWANGTAHRWTPEEARAAGRKGGLANKGRTRRRTRPADGGAV